MAASRRRGLPLAAVAGVLLGLALLTQLPRERPAAPRDADAVRTQLTVRRTATPPPPVPRPAARPAPAPATQVEAEVAGDPAPDAKVELFVDIVDEDGRPTDRAWVESAGCPGFEGAGAGAFRVEAGVCRVRAIRRDGALWARTPVTAIEVVGPDPVYTQLTLSSQRTGGIGVRFMPDGDAVRVVQVVEGGPAWEAGLEVGDRILEVAGEPVSSMDEQDFVDAMTGPEGTEIEFVVEFSEDDGVGEEAVRVQRAFLDG